MYEAHSEGPRKLCTSLGWFSSCGTMHLCHQADLLDTAVYPDIQAMSMGQWDSTNCVEPWVAKRDKIAIQLSIQSVAQSLM